MNDSLNNILWGCLSCNVQILLKTLEDTIYIFTYASIHLFIYMVIHLVSSYLLGIYNMPGFGTIVVSKLDIVTAFWESESSVEDTH